MKVEALEEYQLLPEVLAALRDTIGPELLPLQERALKELGHLGDQNLVVAASATAGRALVGEIAAVKAAQDNAKVLYVVTEATRVDEKH